MGIEGFESRVRVLRFFGENEDEEEDDCVLFFEAAARALHMSASKADGREDDMLEKYDVEEDMIRDDDVCDGLRR